MIDAPVSGGPHDIAAGTVTLYIGGDDEAVQRVHPLLSSYGDPVLHVGPLGFGQRVKLINNTLFAAQIGIVAEAVRLAGRLGVDEATLLTRPSPRQRHQPGPGLDCPRRLGRRIHRRRRRIHRQRRGRRPCDGGRSGQ